MPIRPATEGDLDVVTSVAFAAFPSDPLFPYRLPYMMQYPEDFKKYTRIRYSEYLASPQYEFFVHERPIVNDLHNTEIVAFSVWQLFGRGLDLEDTGDTDKATKKADQNQRRDADPARMAAYEEAKNKAREQFFENKYGEQRLHLSLLACHPDYQRRGIGAELCQWGLGKAQRERLHLTLLASPIGMRLYSRLGFWHVAMLRAQVEGEEAFVDQALMVLESSDDAIESKSSLREDRRKTNRSDIPLVTNLP